MRDAATCYGGDDGPLLLTCEHASARIPAPLRAAATDRRWLDTHWAVDLGAANVTRELARQTGSLAVLARFSRLVCDANRPPDAADWIRREVEGYTLSFNRHVDAAERRRRLARYHEAYHAAVDRAIRSQLRAGREPLLVAIHSFTPRLGDERRTMQVGVLFDERYPVLARRLARRLRRIGLRTALNRPYSGRRGMIHAAQRHGRVHGLPYVELELRQDLIHRPARARRLGRLLAGALLDVAA